ncbi:MAG: NAD(P)-dependent oxidoreductase [Flavobacteriaceae bacterium]|nr:NAD(P)-dependent oxidoreductase [Flavobacteriaceae bacterium]
MKKIALTGATGFIGKNLLKSLIVEYGHENILLIASKKNLQIDTIVYNKDSKKFATNEKIMAEVVIHVGAYTPKSVEEANNVEACNSNISFTAELIKHIDEKQCKKIIYISTLDVYSTVGTNTINENSIINPSTLYGDSKLYCEKMISFYSKKFGISFLNLRLGHIFGKGEEKYHKIIPVTIQKVLEGNPVEIYGDGLAIRSFLNVQDVVTAISNAIKTNVSVNTINVVSENSITIKDLVNKIISFSGQTIAVKHIETKVPNKNFIFDATLLKKYLLPKERNFDIALKEEFDYAKEL